jgi:hypothetical protein
MTTPYCDADQWSERIGYNTFNDFDDEENWPTLGEMQSFLEDATEIMNDDEHIGCTDTNITDSKYTSRLERICYNMANRMFDIAHGRSLSGGNIGAIQPFSLADFLISHERRVLLKIGLTKGYRNIGGVGG